MSDRFVSKCCQGESCFCGAPAEHKVEETIFSDEPPIGHIPGLGIPIHRHPFTAYICHKHFVQIMGPAAK